jgi:hypothetical protein
MSSPSRKKSRSSDPVIQALQQHGRQQRKEHHRFMASPEYKKAASASELPEEHWVAQARTALLRSKRALELATLLFVRKVLRQHCGDAPARNQLGHLVSTGVGRDAVARIVRKAKADRVGTAIADLTICGESRPAGEQHIRRGRESSASQTA